MMNRMGQHRFWMKIHLANSILKARCVRGSALKKNPTEEQQEFYE